jgi:hypothetical protein
VPVDLFGDHAASLPDAWRLGTERNL